MKNNTSKDALSAILGSKTVSYKAEFAKILGSVPAAVMLSQAFFWQENAKFKTGLIRIGEDVYFSKTSKEWEEETGLSKDQQLTARKVLVAAGMMKEVKYGMPAVMHYRMDIDATVDGIARYNETGSAIDGKPAVQLTGNPRTSSGRFRRIEDGNPDNIKESLNSFESEEGERKTPTPSIPETFPLEEKKEKEKIPGGGAAARRYDHQVFQNTPTQEPFSLEAGIAEIRANPFMREAFTKAKRVPAELFDSYLTEFALEQVATGAIHHNLADLRKHFLNYAAKRYESEQKRKALASPKTKSAAPRAWGGDETDYTAPQAF